MQPIDWSSSSQSPSSGVSAPDQLNSGMAPSSRAAEVRAPSSLNIPSLSNSPSLSPPLSSWSHSHSPPAPAHPLLPQRTCESGSFLSAPPHLYTGSRPAREEGETLAVARVIVVDVSVVVVGAFIVIRKRFGDVRNHEDSFSTSDWLHEKTLAG